MGALGHVRWIGGGSGAGKSTVAHRLAARYGCAVYSTDATLAGHAAALDTPLLAGFRAMTMDQRWVTRDPATMYRTFPWFHGEGFALLVEDLVALQRDRITLVEGFRLLPHLVRPLLATPAHGVWLLPTPGFRRRALATRDGADAFWSRTTDPARALENLLTRDALFTDRIATEATRAGLPTLPVDGTRTVDDLADHLATRFGL